MNNILVYRIGSIGDTLVALPAFWALRKAFPDAKITYFTNGDSPDINKLIAKKILPEGIFDDWIVYPKNFIQSAPKLIWDLRKKKFDSLFYLMTRNRQPHRIKRDLFFFRAAGIKKNFGVKYLSENLLTMTPEKPVKAVETELEFLINSLYFENLPLPPQIDLSPDLKLTADELKQSHNWLEKNCPQAQRGKKMIGIMAGTNWSSKIWAEENYLTIVSRLIEEQNIFPVVFGGKNDREQGDRFIKHWKTGVNAAGELGLRGDAGILKECALYLGTDTGTMHLAGSVGIPCVAVFAATDYIGRWTPYGAGHKIFRERVECEGCFAPVCFNNHKCLNLVSPEKVYQACVEILDDNSKQ